MDIVLININKPAAQVMATDAPPGERRLRGAGIYVGAAMLNHDCLPNLARLAFVNPLGCITWSTSC